MSGRTWAELPHDADLKRARTIHHVIEVLHEDRVSSLDDVRESARTLDVPALAGASSFRVTAHREGEHAFSTDALAGAVGAALQRRHGTPVDLNNFQVHVRADLYGSRLIVGVQRTSKDLSKRIRRPQPLRTAVKASIAASMLRLVGAHASTGTLCDPMCGSGTILVEACETNPSLRVLGFDWDDDTVEIARGTVANHALQIPIAPLEISDLSARVGPTLDFVITDPPYGIRRGRRMRLDDFYTTMLDSIHRATTKCSRVAIISPRVKAMQKALANSPLTADRVIQVRAGGLTPHIWVLSKT
ncbi:MAG: THUMP domain-containing protein [Pseudomonadales bacterium]|nr:THUMP domain-containing protein [Pseudomonadales bacterium]